MVPDTVALLRRQGPAGVPRLRALLRRLPARPRLRRAGARGRGRRRRRRRRAVRHQRRHAADGRRPGRRRGAGRAPASGSASTARTTPAARWPTPWPPSRPARPTSSAPPTATASGPATPTCSRVVGNLVTKMGLPVLPDGVLAEMMRVSPRHRRAGQHRPGHPPGLRRGVGVRAQGGAARLARSRSTRSCTTTSTRRVVGNDMRILVTEMAGRASVELKAPRAGRRPGRAGRRDRPGRRPGQGAGGRRLVVRGRRRLVRAAAARRAARRPVRAAVQAGVLPGDRRALRERRASSPRRRSRCTSAASGSSPPPRATARSTPWTRRCAGAGRAATRSSAEVELADYKVRILGWQGRHRRDHPGAGRHAPTAAREWTTVGVHDNVVEASWQALVDALTVCRSSARSPRAQQSTLAHSLGLHEGRGLVLAGETRSAQQAELVALGVGEDVPGHPSLGPWPTSTGSAPEGQQPLAARRPGRGRWR